MNGNTPKFNSRIFSKGDILKATHRGRTEGYHYIVYYQENSDSAFYGAMITHTDDARNVAMKPEHFRLKDNADRPYPVRFDATYLVKGKFLKLEGWGPFRKVGELTAEGIRVLDSVIGDLPSETFEEYGQRKHSP